MQRAVALTAGKRRRGLSQGDPKRIGLGLGLVVVGLVLSFGGVFPLFGAMVSSDTNDAALVSLGLAALIPGVLLVTAGIWVMARSPGRRAS